MDGSRVRKASAPAKPGTSTDVKKVIADWEVSHSAGLVGWWVGGLEEKTPMKHRCASLKMISELGGFMVS